LNQWISNRGLINYSRNGTFIGDESLADATVTLSWLIEEAKKA